MKKFNRAQRRKRAIEEALEAVKRKAALDGYLRGRNDGEAQERERCTRLLIPEGRGVNLNEIAATLGSRPYLRVACPKQDYALYNPDSPVRFDREYVELVAQEVCIGLPNGHSAYYYQWGLR